MTTRSMVTFLIDEGSSMPFLSVEICPQLGVSLVEIDKWKLKLIWTMHNRVYEPNVI